MVVTRPKIVKNKAKHIEQIIKEVHKGYVTVISRKDSTYKARLSDKLELKLIHKNDIAIIDTETWKVIDIIHKHKKQDKNVDLEKQEKELLDKGYDY